MTKIVKKPTKTKKIPAKNNNKEIEEIKKNIKKLERKIGIWEQKYYNMHVIDGPQIKNKMLEIEHMLNVKIGFIQNEKKSFCQKLTELFRKQK